MAHDNLEVEVKFLVDDLAEWRERLLAIGAELIRPRLFERNVRLDTADEALLQQMQLLRLRQDMEVTLTFKGPATEVSSEAKVREELEVTVSDYDTAVLIFRRLGLAPVQVYEKYRETFELSGVEVVLDELPFGNFLELEGDEAGIKTAVSALNLEWAKRLTTNYLALMAQVKAHYNLPFVDLTFANFADLSVSVADVL